MMIQAQWQWEWTEVGNSSGGNTSTRTASEAWIAAHHSPAVT